MTKNRFFSLGNGLVVNLDQIVWIDEDDKGRVTIYASGPRLDGDVSHRITDPKVAKDFMAAIRPS